MIPLNVVLVRPQYSSNIGASARALANLGGSRLILINPQCSIDEAAHQAAAGAQKWLEQVTIYQSFDDYYRTEPEGARLALSRRQGRKRPSQELGEALREWHEQAPYEVRDRPISLFFGPEASGLSQEDMSWTNRIAHLPIEGEFQSLNLAQAVLLALFVAQQTLKEFVTVESPTTKLIPAPRSPDSKEALGGPLSFPDDSIRRWLQAMGFSIEKRKKSAYLTLRRLLLRNWPSPGELLVLQAILEQNIRKLEERSATTADSLAFLEEVPDQLTEIGVENVDLLGLPRQR